jgi:hypothetical protein
MTTPVLLRAELLPELEALERLLPNDGVRSQQLIELLATRHALRMPGHERFVANAMHKHITQLIAQFKGQ